MPVITLTTDFGAGSPYVAAMKARLLEGCPTATLVDIAHSVPAFDLGAAGFLLWAGTRHFAPGAVHLCVVDPGVGGARRAVAFSLAGSFYVGPDNGVFGMLLRESLPHVPAAVELRRSVDASPTFEGRDVFAPAAAALASGTPLKKVGSAAAELMLPPAPRPSVLWVDAFGNLVTSLKPPVGGVRVGPTEIRLSARTYSDAPRGRLFWYVGSMGLVEVGLREDTAAGLLDAGPGTPVQPL